MRHAIYQPCSAMSLRSFNAVASALIALAISGCASESISRLTAANYTLKQTFKLGGEGGWDYLSYDAISNRLFIARATRVQVVDPDKGIVVAEIADTPGVHGVALARDLGKGYTSNGRNNSVTVFDLNTLKTLANIKTPIGENPDFIAYDATTKRIVAFNGRSKNASVIDAVNDKLITTIPLNGKPESAAADNVGKGVMFVNIEDTNEVTTIDLRTNTVAANWPLSGCKDAVGLAIDVTARRLFAGCHNKLLFVLNADNGKLVTTMPIGEGVDANAFDNETRRIFSSQADGSLTILSSDGADKFTVQQTVATPRGARTMALNPKNHDVYLVSAEYDEAPAADGQRPKRTIRPGSFMLSVYGQNR